METLIFLLAIVGIAFLFRILSKFFNKVGNLFDKIGDAIADRSISKTYGDPTEKNTKNIKEKIHSIKGEGTDEEYWKRIRAEINDLTDTEEE